MKSDRQLLNLKQKESVLHKENLVATSSQNTLTVQVNNSLICSQTDMGVYSLDLLALLYHNNDFKPPMVKVKKNFNLSLHKDKSNSTFKFIINFLA